MTNALRTATLAFLALIISVGASAQQNWMDVAPMPTPRAFPSVAVLNGQIYVIGGRNANGTELDVVERYDPVSNTWSAVEALRNARFNASATVFNGQILLTGGREVGELTDDAEVYDPIDARWESFDHLQDKREGHGVFSVGGDVYVFGGLNEALQYRDDAEVYNEGTGNWDDYGFWVLNQPRAAFGAIPEGNGVLIFGGFGPFGPVAGVEFYVPNQTGESRATMPGPRGSLASAKAGNLIFAIGGRNAGGSVVGRVDAYNSNVNQWATWPSLPEPREGAVAAGVGNDLYVFGGQTDTGVLATSALMLSTVTANEADAPDADFAIASVGPNPFSDAISVTITSDASTELTVAIYDVLGRRVAILRDGLAAPGRQTLAWRGVDDGGRALSAGMYILRVSDGRQTLVRRITLLR